MIQLRPFSTSAGRLPWVVAQQYRTRCVTQSLYAHLSSLHPPSRTIAVGARTSRLSHAVLPFFFPIRDQPRKFLEPSPLAP